MAIDSQPVNLAALVMSVQQKALTPPASFGELPVPQSTPELPQNAPVYSSRAEDHKQEASQQSDPSEDEKKQRAATIRAGLGALSSQLRELESICKDKNKKQYLTILEAHGLGARTIEEIIQYAKTESITLDAEVV